MRWWNVAEPCTGQLREVKTRVGTLLSDRGAALVPVLDYLAIEALGFYSEAGPPSKPVHGPDALRWFGARPWSEDRQRFARKAGGNSAKWWAN